MMTGTLEQELLDRKFRVKGTLGRDFRTGTTEISEEELQDRSEGQHACKTHFRTGH
jgi:hypothetical protein